MATKAEPTVLAIGFFDGVHLGHQRVIKAARRIAQQNQMKLSVMTFSPHPKEVLSNGKAIVQYLTSLSEKKAIFDSLGVDICYVVEFTSELSVLPPKIFVKQYLVNMCVRHVVAGYDFTYGVKGTGNMNRLLLDSEKKLAVTTVPKVECGEEKISSTLIRQLLNEGAVAKLPQYLGRYYFSRGTINQNKQRYITTIVPVSPYSLPKNGIYQISLCSANSEVNTDILIKGNQMILNPNVSKLFISGEKVTVIWKERVSSTKEKVDTR